MCWKPNKLHLFPSHTAKLKIARPLTLLLCLIKDVFQALVLNKELKGMQLNGPTDDRKLEYISRTNRYSKKLPD